MKVSMSSFQEQQALEQSLKNLDLVRPLMDELRQSLQEHLKSIEQLVIGKRANYEKALTELENQKSELKAKIKKYDEEKSKISSIIRKEIEDKEKTSIKVREMRAQQEQLTKQSEKFHSDIKSLDREIDANVQKLNNEKTILSDQKSRIADRTFQFEQLLGMRIETGGENNSISFIFRNVDPDNFQREVYFVLDPAKYQIVKTSPELPDSDVSEIMNRFAKHKEIGYLWRDMRIKLREKLLEKSE